MSYKVILSALLCVLVAGCDSRNATETKTISAPLAANAEPSITTKRVDTTGTAKTFDEALKSALILAVGEVNGVSVAQSDISDHTIGSYHESAKSDASLKENVTLNERASDGSGTLTAQANSSVTQNGSAEADFDLSHELISAASQTSGAVRQYQVLSSGNKEGIWTVSIRAEIAVYQASEASKRLKIAVLPFRVTANIGSPEYESTLRSEITNRFTASSKFAVLDRDYAQEDKDELSTLQDPDANKTEVAKLGNKLGADYILVGTIKSADVHRDSQYLRSVDKTIYGKTHAQSEIDYRLIETATGVIALSGHIPPDKFDVASLTDLASTQANFVSDAVIQTLFPLRVESIANGVVYLGQGADSIHVGDKFNLVQEGKPITDSYTHEVLGNEETTLGQIVVTEVQPKLSKAVALPGTKMNVSDPHTLVARLVSSQEIVPATKAELKAGDGANGAEPVKKTEPTDQSPDTAKSLLDKAKRDY